MRGLNKLFFLGVLVTLAGCIDQIDVDTDTEPSRLVVDGYITSEPRVHKVRLIETVQFSNEANTPVQGASVEVIGSDGEIVPFTEAEPGYYYSNCCFGAQQGVSYIIRVVYNGKTVESTEQVLPPKIPMQELSYRADYKQVFRAIDNSLVDEPGIWISTEIAKVEREKEFYFWQPVPTYIWEANRARNENVRICWVTASTRFQDIYIHEEQEGGYERDLLWIPAGRDMQQRYALQINQFNINEDTYDFWDRIKQQKENVGSIFDTPPSSIEGNLRNVNDNKDIILGYFGVFEVSQQTIYVELDDLPFNLDLIDVCASLFRGRPPECLDCRENNAGISTNIKPLWWED